MSFEVASVRRSNTPRPPNFSLGMGNAKPPGGRLSATFPLDTYIGFAYKLAPFQTGDAVVNAPKWLRTDFFEIDAEAPGNLTKDQMRLMMQSLLADRFKLAVHFETKEVPVLALRQVKPGKLGPKLLPHSQGPPCPDEYREPEPAAMPDPRKEVFPPNCDLTQSRGMPDGTWFVGSRNTAMASVAQEFFTFGFLAGEIDRPTVDQTGLKGRFDFVLEYKPSEGNRFVPPGAAAPSGEFGGTPFLEALRQQLGLKLVRTKAPVRTLVIDHVERPSPN